MLIAGILLVAVAVALGFMIFFSPASIVGWGITPEVAVILLVGGVLTLGLGGVISALEAGAAMPEPNLMVAPPVKDAETVIPAFNRRKARATEEISPAVDETIKALEQAKTGIRQALGEEPRNTAVAPEQAGEPAVEDRQPVEEAAAEADSQLYVVEERRIRNRPARILSDGTVEAETDEGWMRFENLDHLDEYLDAMAPSGKV